jgi:PAS domain S-box-containing protein
MRLLNTLPNPTASAVARYALALVSVEIALGIALLLGGYAFSLMLTAIAVAVWYGGLGPGLLAIALSTLSVDYFFRPLHPVQPGGPSLRYFAFFFAFTVVVCWLIASRKRVELSLQAARSELEAKVLERTGELRKSTAEALAAQQRFSDLVNSVKGIVWEADAETFAFSFVSAQAERILGYPAEQWLSEPAFWSDHLHLDDRDKMISFYHQAVAEERQQDCEYRMIAADGRVVWIRDLVTVVIEQGRATRLRGVMMDVTRRKRNQEALERSERNLAEAQRLTHTGSYAWNVKTKEVVYLSDEWYRIYGFEPEEGSGAWEKRLRRFHPDDLKRWETAVSEAIRNKSDYSVEYRIVLPDGPTKYLRVVGHPVQDSSGDVTQFFGTVTDVTERKQAEEALRRSETYLAEAQRLTHTGSWAWDPQTLKALYWSDEMFRIFRFDPRQGLPTGEMYKERIHSEDFERLRQLRHKALRDKADYVAEHRIVLPDGTVEHIQTIAHPVLNTAGEIIEYVGTAVNITGRKRAEEERERLRELQEELAHINRVNMMGELAASLAHEIKQPIAAAITSADACLRWLARTPPDLERARLAAIRIKDDGTRAAEVITRLRSFYKKGTPPEREMVDINSLVEEMIVMLRNEAARHSVTIRPELRADVPTILADRVQLQQVFMNLMLNAMDAMKDGGGELAITSEPNEDGHLTISVSDTGVGLPGDAADRIFDAFYTTKPQGTGMGLAITRSIVESHGGRLWATNNNGRGATFHFTLSTTAEAHA